MDGLAIVVNKKAKNFSAFHSYIEALSKSGLNYTLYQTQPAKLESVIKKCVAKHAILLVGGGDGTVRTAAQHCVNTGVLLGILPLGTLNHFVAELGLPSNPEALVNAIIKKKTTTIDSGSVNGLIFVNNSSIGFYPKFAKKRDEYNRFYNKWLCYLPSFIQTLKRHEVYTLLVNTKKFKLTLKTSFLMISNNAYTYQFPLSFQRDNFKKSQLGMYYFKHGKLQILRMIRYWWNRKKNFEITQSKQPIEITVVNQDKIAISLDGETIVTQSPLVYQSLPKSLTLLKNPL